MDFRIKFAFLAVAGVPVAADRLRHVGYTLRLSSCDRDLPGTLRGESPLFTRRSVDRCSQQGKPLFIFDKLPVSHRKLPLNDKFQAKVVSFFKILLRKNYFCLMNNAAKVKINAQNLGLDEILAGVAQLDTPELENFMQEVSSIVAHRKAPSLSKQEEVLLNVINRGMPADWVRRYKKLHGKMRDGTLTEEEYKELLIMVETIEEKNVERLQALIGLAQLRKVSLDKLMNQLGLLWPKNAR